MGADRNISQAHVIVAAAGSTISRAMRAANLTNLTVQTIWSGGTTPSGTVTLEVSHDHQENFGVVTNAGTWTALTTPAALAISGASGNGLQQVTNLSVPWIRVNYNLASGALTKLDAYFFGTSA